MTRLEIATRLLSNSPWLQVSRDQGRGADHVGELLESALRVSDRLISLEDRTRVRPPPPKKLFPGVRRFFSWLVARIYR